MDGFAVGMVFEFSSTETQVLIVTSCEERSIRLKRIKEYLMEFIKPANYYFKYLKSLYPLRNQVLYQRIYRPRI
jgi:hypothetical protein